MRIIGKWGEKLEKERGKESQEREREEIVKKERDLCSRRVYRPTYS